jgi:DNA-binding NarL/FixJ family response regulator
VTSARARGRCSASIAFTSHPCPGRPHRRGRTDVHSHRASHFRPTGSSFLTGHAAFPAAGATPAPQALAASPGLTAREGEVIALIAEGLSNAEIAGRLVVSEATVKSHVNHLLGKIGVRSRAQAVSVAYQHGFAAHGRPRRD